MALTGEELTDEIRAIVGREGAADKGSITDTRVTRWLNEAQVEIVEKCPGLHGMSFKNTISLDTTVTLSYSIADITVGDISVEDAVCRIWDVYYLNGNLSVHLDFMMTDEFDEMYPDPTHTDIPHTQPTHWTRRGNTIEMFPLCLTTYCDKDLRFDGDSYAGDFTTNDASSSDITGADEGLIMYGVARAWEAIGDQKTSFVWDKKFDIWLDDFKAQNDDLDEWDGKMFGADLI